MPSPHKLEWADNIRFFATFGVIILHCAAPGLYFYGKVSLSHWLLLDLMDSAMRCCVPLFVMLTGALLLRQDKALLPYLKNRFLRVVVPFLFWALIYCLIFMKDKLLYGEIREIPKLLGEIINSIIYHDGVLGQHAYHLWYIYMILGLYLVIPILRGWIKNTQEKEIVYFLILWGISTVVLNPLLEDYNPGIELTFFGSFTGYLVLGYYLSIKSFEKNRFILKGLGIFTILLIGFTTYATYFLSNRDGELNQDFYEYLSPNILLLSAAIFILLKKIEIKNNYFKRLSSLTNKYSFGVYLVHVLILAGLDAVGLNWKFIHPLIGIPLTTIACFSFSSILIYLVAKIPYGQHING